MNLRRLVPMYRRDLRDAIRDGRILIAVLIPVALAVYYGLAFPAADELPSTTLVVAGPVSAQVVADVRDAAKGSLDVTVEAARSADAVRSAVEDDGDAVGLVLPRDVDAALEAGRAANVELLVDADASSPALQLAAIVEGVTARAGAEPPPLRVERSQLGADAAPSNAFESLGIARASIILCIIMLACFIAFLAVPVLLMEEVQLRTLEALQLVASTWEIIVAKLLVGLTYCALAIAITLAIVDIEITQPVAFVAATLAISLVLVGWGLAFGLWMGDPGRVNTWSGVILLPLMVPVFVSLAGDWTWAWTMDLIPTGGGALLLAATMDPDAQQLTIAPVAALVAWALAGFALLWWLLDRRDA